MRLSRKNLISFIVIIVLAAGLTFASVYLKNVADYKQAVNETAVSEIDLSKVPDGIYSGEYDVNFISAKVEVTVQDGRITDLIILEHKNERGKSAEIIVDQMIEEQKVDVDAVSGATNSSIVIKKAVEKALQNGLS